MYRVIYTKVLENPDEADVRVESFKDMDSAINHFSYLVCDLMDRIIKNQYLKVQFNIHKYTAIVKVEDEKYCIAMREDRD